MTRARDRADGGVVQVVNTTTGAVATGTTTMPQDDTIPQNTEGDEYMTLAITPKDATNKLKIDVVWHGSSGASSGIMVAGLLYHYSVQQQSNKVEAYGPMYFRTMNRILFNRKYGNAKIELSPLDRGEGNCPTNKAYDAGRT